MVPLLRVFDQQKGGKNEIIPRRKKWLLFNRQVFFLLLYAPIWLREPDSNRRFSTYEDDEMTDFSIPQYLIVVLLSLLLNLYTAYPNDKATYHLSYLSVNSDIFIAYAVASVPVVVETRKIHPFPSGYWDTIDPSGTPSQVRTGVLALKGP